jgi:phosphomevalonate kinase
MSESVVAVSAPGKVLFAGGYLVLDRQHTGLVFGLDARIHIHARWCPSHNPAENHIVVASPQFDAKWTYGFSATDGRVDVHPE